MEEREECGGRTFNVFVQFIPDAWFREEKCAPVPSAALECVRQREFEQAAYAQAYAADESDDAQEPDGRTCPDASATSSHHHHVACVLRTGGASRTKRSRCGACGGGEGAVTGRKRGTVGCVEDAQGDQAPFSLARTEAGPPEQVWQAWQGSQPTS